MIQTTTFLGKGDKVVTGEVILSEDRLDSLVAKLMRIDEFAFDTETNTLRVQAEGFLELVGISICFGEEDSYYIPTGHLFDENQLSVDLVVRKLRKPFERKDVRIIGMNIKFDRHVLTTVGIDIKTKDIFDIMLGRWITDENEEMSLKAMTSNVYGIKQTKFDECLKTVTKEEKKFAGLKASSKAPFQLVRIKYGAPYATADAYWTWRHYCDWQLEEIELEKVEYFFYKMLTPFNDTLFNMERRGIRVDKARLEKMQEKVVIDLAELEQEMFNLVGTEFNPNSSSQLGELLFNYPKVTKDGKYTGNKELLDKSYCFPVESKTKGGAPASGAPVLKELAKKTYVRDIKKQEGIELVKLILKYKRLAKLKSAFIDGLLDKVYPDGRIHCSFKAGGTDSGRISSSDPNLQQLPRPVDVPDKEEYLKTKEYEEFKVPYKERFKEDLFWKFYEIRDVFIADSEDDVLVAFDKTNVEVKPCELLEVPKVA